jgi:hypothetical protein
MTDADRLERSRRDAYYLLVPLELNGLDSAAAHVRHLVRLLRDRSLPSPAAAAMSHMVKLYERSVPPHPAIVCKKGCDYCCRQPVSLTAPEAFFVAAQLQETTERRQKIAEAAGRAAALEPERPLSQWPQCPLLADAACSIYTARPLGCRAFVSLDLQACLTAFVDHGPVDIHMPQQRSQMLYACRVIQYAALRLAGLPARSYEMTRAVAAILAQPEAEARWLAGEDILAGLEEQKPVPAQIETQIADLAALVLPTL